MKPTERGLELLYCLSNMEHPVGVREAVDEWVRATGHDLRTGPARTWYVWKPA